MSAIRLTATAIVATADSRRNVLLDSSVLSCRPAAGTVWLGLRTSFGRGWGLFMLPFSECMMRLCSFCVMLHVYGGVLGCVCGVCGWGLVELLGVGLLYICLLRCCWC